MTAFEESSPKKAVILGFRFLLSDAVGLGIPLAVKSAHPTMSHTIGRLGEVCYRISFGKRLPATKTLITLQGVFPQKSRRAELVFTAWPA